MPWLEDPSNIPDSNFPKDVCTKQHSRPCDIWNLFFYLSCCVFEEKKNKTFAKLYYLLETISDEYHSRLDHFPIPCITVTFFFFNMVSSSVTVRGCANCSVPSIAWGTIGFSEWLPLSKCLLYGLESRMEIYETTGFNRMLNEVISFPAS